MFEGSALYGVSDAFKLACARFNDIELSCIFNVCMKLGYFAKEFFCAKALTLFIVLLFIFNPFNTKGSKPFYL